MSKHTPGPWIWRAGYDGEVIDVASYKSPGFYNNPVLHSASGDEIIGCDEYWTLGPSVKPAESVANARLIAAAPDLLEALKDLRPALLADFECGEAGGLTERSRKAAAKLVMDAIAKAEGR